MKVTDIIIQLHNKFNEEWLGKRFDHIDEAHSAIKEIADNILPENLYIAEGEIKGYGLRSPLFTYEFDYDKDKRHKKHIAGRMNEVKVTPTRLTDKDATVDDLFLIIKKEQLQEDILKSEENIGFFKSKLLEEEEKLKQSKEKLQKLPN